MKLTKVNNLRIAVSSNKQPSSGYGILYSTPNSTKELNSVEVQVEGRIKSANRLYGVFFRSDIPDVLDKLFEGLVNQIRNADVNEKEKALQKFTKIVSETEIGKKIVWVEDFSYSSPRKHIKNVLGLYVRERLVDKWQVEYRRKAAVEILCCLCDGKNYAKKIMDLNTEVVNDFIEACLDVSGKAGSKVFVYKTRDLETAFTELIKLLVKKCKIELYTNIEQARFNEKIQQDIAVQIDYAKNLSFYENKGEKVYLNNIFYYGATADRMDAVVERMRRTMKRGNNRKVAVKLLIALANKSWKSTIEAMMNDESERKQLINFIYAVNIDYHRLNIIRSIKRLKVKVKVNEENVQEKMLILSSAEDKKKVGLNETLISYASSKENADETLLRIKGIVFDYFLGKDRQRTEEDYFKGKKAMFEGAVHFLLKEIYYQDFTVSGHAAAYFFNAVEAYFVEQGGCVSKKGKEVFYGLRNGEDIKTYRSKYPYHDAAKSFVLYVDKLKLEKMSLGNICQAILTEYNQQNSKVEKDETIFKHYKLLFELCMRNAFIKYVDDNYAFIKAPVIKDEEVIQDYLEETPIYFLDYLIVQESDAEKEKNKYMWYTFAHFIHPKQLNHLVGDFKNYIQFRKDIIKRAYYAKEIDIQGKQEWEDSISEELKSVEEVLQVFEFVRGVAGRVSNVYKDYYRDEEEYAQYLSQHIDFENVHEGTVFDSLRIFCQNALPDAKIIDIYADEKNPKVLRNIELTRMYAGGDIILEGDDKVSVDEIKKYYEEQPEIQKILSEGLCQSREEQIRVRKQQSRKERITLNDITGIWQIIYDLHAKLVSMAYLRERDEMYLFLGFYYLALQNPEGWPNEKLETLNMGKVNIQSGFVLYSVVSVFTYGLDFLYEGIEKGKMKLKKRGGEVGTKITGFGEKYKDSFECALRIFENTRSDREINDVRNYVDHFKYFIHHDKSIVDLYNEYYQRMFTYSSKLQKSVWENFVSILKKQHVLATLLLIHRNNLCCFALNEEKVTSEKFTFKLKDKSSVYIDAKEVEFLKKLCAYLNYRR